MQVLLVPTNPFRLTISISIFLSEVTFVIVGIRNNVVWNVNFICIGLKLKVRNFTMFPFYFWLLIKILIERRKYSYLRITLNWFVFINLQLLVGLLISRGSILVVLQFVVLGWLQGLRPVVKYWLGTCVLKILPAYLW